MAVHPREKQAYMNAAPDQREVVRYHLCNLLALLRAQYMSYQTSHWQQAGVAYYGNHLLFQRLYESVTDQVDQLAEKIVGYLGAPPVDLGPQARLVSQYAARWNAVQDCHHKRGLQSEQDCQEAIKAAYDGIKAAKAMTLGLDDWLMATANAHEENQYLLQRVLATPPMEATSLVEKWAALAVAPTADADFRPNPRKEEVSQFAESGAISNDPEIAAAASKELDLPAATEQAEVLEAPPTPTEIAKDPGAAAVSTLNRYVVESEDPEAEKAVAMNRQRMAAWLAQLEGGDPSPTLSNSLQGDS